MSPNRSTNNPSDQDYSADDQRLRYRQPSGQPRPRARTSSSDQRPTLGQQIRTGAPSVRARADQARVQERRSSSQPRSSSQRPPASGTRRQPARDSQRPSAGGQRRTSGRAQQQRPAQSQGRTYRSPSARPTQNTSGLPRWLPLVLMVVGLALIAYAVSTFFGARAPEQPAATESSIEATISQASSAQAVDGTQTKVEVPMPSRAQSSGIVDYAVKMVGYTVATAPLGDWSVSFASTGDMIFGRQVGDFVDMYGGAATLERVADQLSAPDVTIGNLEAPLSNDESEAKWAKDVIIIGRPEGIDGLKAADFTFVSLANNHSMDYGAPALADTINALDAAGIKHAGAGMNYDEAWQLAETTVNGVRIAFLSFTDVIPEDFLAYETSAGVAGARIDMDETCKAISNAKKKHDIVVVAMHWGIEYEDYITEYMQSEPAHQMVDAGADIILGNHPHVIQGIEFYKGALISYSQGDFVFDHFSSRKTGETFILDFDVTNKGVQNVRATPIYLEDPYGIPYVLEGQEAADVLDRLELISEGMNTTFERQGDIDFITATDGVNKHAR